MGSNRPDERRVLLRMDEGENRRLLANWLAGETGYLPVVADADDAFNAEFDCVVVDTETIRSAGDDLAARRRIEPGFLPVLLVLPKPSGENALQPLDQLPEHVSGSVDETIRAPIQRPVLKRRLETLFRTREYAEQLNRTRDRYHRLLELFPEAVLLLRHGDVEYVNEAGIALFGRDEPTLVGSHPTQFVDEGDRHALARYLYDLVDGRAEDGVRVTVSAAGEPIPVEFRGVRLFEEGADAPLLQLLVRDLRTVEESLELR